MSRLIFEPTHSVNRGSYSHQLLSLIECPLLVLLHHSPNMNAHNRSISVSSLPFALGILIVCSAAQKDWLLNSLMYSLSRPELLVRVAGATMAVQTHQD